MEVSGFGINNRTTPLLGGVFVRRSMNTESLQPGRCAKRRGINAPVGLDREFGVGEPYRVFAWEYTGGGGGTARIAYGAGSLAFVNPVNNYLYARTALGGDTIRSSPPAADISASWGLPLPANPLNMDNNAGSSLLHGGAYVYAVCAYASNRRVLSPPVFGTSVTAGGLSTWLQWVPGPGWHVIFPAVPTAPAGADEWWLFRERFQTLDPSLNWMPINVSRWGTSGMKLVQRKTAPLNALNADYGGQPPSNPILRYSHTVVPYGEAFCRADGKWFYATSNTVYYTNPDCPETYCGPTTATMSATTAPIPSPTLAVTEDGIIAGEATLTLDPSQGDATGIVTYGGRILVLCEHGAWELVPLASGALYGVNPNPLSVGCVSRQTICDTPYGMMWLSRQGIALWAGEGAPVIITKPVLDPKAPETEFLDDLSPCGALYDYNRDQYQVMMPKEPGAEAPKRLLVLQADRLEDQQVDLRVWEIANEDPMIGLGWDNVNRRPLYMFAGFKDNYLLTPTDDTYRDVDAQSGNTYEMGLEIWVGSEPGEPDVLSNVGLFVIPLRQNLVGTQTVSVDATGLATFDVSAAAGVSGETLSWPANDQIGRGFDAVHVSGRLLRFELSHEDALPFEILAADIGQAGRRRNS